jgi:hypothetical protein
LSALAESSLRTRLVGTALAIFVGFSVCYLTMLHIGLSMKQWDFLYYYSGSHLTLSGHAGSVFNLQAIGELERHLAYPLSVRNGGLPYVYPPFLAVALAPVAGTSLRWRLPRLARCGFGFPGDRPGPLGGLRASEPRGQNPPARSGDLLPPCNRRRHTGADFFVTSLGPHGQPAGH